MFQGGIELRSKKMTSIEKEQWDKLYQYVKNEILLYDSSQSIPSGLVLRLKGLTKGKYMENRNIDDKADYSYEIVLYTFQICKPSIMRTISNKVFESKSNKFNYICKIVENNINDVYLRVEKVKKIEENIDKLDTNILSHNGGEYQKKTEELRNKRLNELW